MTHTQTRHVFAREYKDRRKSARATMKNEGHTNARNLERGKMEDENVSGGSREGFGSGGNSGGGNCGGGGTKRLASYPEIV